MSCSDELAAGESKVSRAAAALKETRLLIEQHGDALKARDLDRCDSIAARLNEIFDAIEADHLAAGAIIKAIKERG